MVTSEPTVRRSVRRQNISIPKCFDDVHRPTMSEGRSRPWPELPRVGIWKPTSSLGTSFGISVQAIRTALTGSLSDRTGKPLSPATINKILSALRGVLREAWRLGLMNAEDLARAVDVEPVKGSRPLRGRALAHREVVALFDACARDSSPTGTRDAVILALGLGAGLRRAEIVGLQLADVKLDLEIIRVLGKGKKIRGCP